MGMIDHYLKTDTISTRMKSLINRTLKQMSHILIDAPAKWRRVDARIARELSHMVKTKFIDTEAYFDTVNKKKVRKPSDAAALPSLKSVARSRKRKLCRALKRNNTLRYKVRYITFAY